MRRRYIELAEAADVFRGYSPKPSQRLSQGRFRLLTGRNIDDAGLRLRDTDEFIDTSSEPSFDKAVLRENDVVLTILFEHRKIYVYGQNEPDAIATSSLAILRPRDDLYIRDYLNTVAGRQRLVQETARRTKGEHISRVNLRDLRQVRIPILSSEEIQTLVESQQNLVGNELLSLIAKGESAEQEFKSTIRKNLRTKQVDEKMEDAVLKTIAAFCNSSGGTLLIGVDDSGNILGIEADGFKNTDRFLLHLGNLIMDRLSPPPTSFVEYRVLRYAYHSVCVVDCRPSDTDIWVYSKSKSVEPKLFIRSGPASKPLEGPEITRYYRNRFG